MRFGNTGGNRSNSNLSHQLHMHSRVLICIFEVMDKLCQIFNGVNIVMRWWGDQPDTWGGVANPSDPGIDLITRELSALTWFCPLRHFNLNII